MTNQQLAFILMKYVILILCTVWFLLYVEERRAPNKIDVEPEDSPTLTMIKCCMWREVQYCPYCGTKMNLFYSETPIFYTCWECLGSLSYASRVVERTSTKDVEKWCRVGGSVSAQTSTFQRSSEFRVLVVLQQHHIKLFEKIMELSDEIDRCIVEKVLYKEQYKFEKKYYVSRIDSLFCSLFNCLDEFYGGLV